VEVLLTAVGDIWFARNVGKMIDEHGLDYPFELVGERMRAGDITWCNFEAPLTTAETALPGKALWFKAKPETVKCLVKAGMDVVALANNHILDYDSPGLVETLDILDRAGIAYCGAGRDMAEARSPAIMEVNGLKVAFLAYTEFADPGLWWDESYRRTFMAGDGNPGCAPIDMTMVAEDIERTRKEADLIVVGYHWGREDEPYPLRYNPKNDLESIARETIDLGACLVLGTHPHAVQGFEHHRGGLIAYSLGNFVTDQKRDTQREGLILEVQLGPSGVLSARLIPIWIEGHRPGFMEGEEALCLLEWVEIISIPLNSPAWKGTR
jgi:poly-gamma-glutamate synthesis protein (capsule biosynthesis protein)